jgi:hypothetical protein
MVIDKQVHKEFLLEVIRSTKFGGSLEQIEETARIGRELIEAIEKAEVKEK